MRKASTVLPACAHDLVGGTVLGRIDGHGHVIGQHVGRRRIDDDFGLLAQQHGVVGAHQHLFQRHAVFEAQAHRVRRGLFGLEVGDEGQQAQFLASSGEVGGLGRQVRGHLEGNGGCVLGGHAAGTTATDHSRCALLQFQHVGLGGVGSVGGRGQQCGCGHGREKRFLHGWTPIAPSQVRV